VSFFWEFSFGAGWGPGMLVGCAGVVMVRPVAPGGGVRAGASDLLVVLIEPLSLE